MKIIKTTSIIFIFLLILAAIFPVGAFSASVSDLPDLDIGTWAGDGTNPGDGHRYIDMGSYNGHTLRWRVLDVYISDGTDGNTAGSKTALLLLDDVLFTPAGDIERRVFDTYNSYSSNWARPSDIKTFLNGAFYDTAFNTDEQSSIITANYRMGGSYEGYFGFPITDSSKVFLLSTDEALNPAYFANSADRALANSDWWLRSPGDTFYYAANVRTTGTAVGIGNAVDNSRGVRPALKLDLSSVVFTSADYSAVEAAVAAANALDRNLYVSFAGVDAAIAAVVYGLDITQQTAVDGFAAAINAAVAALQIKTYTVTFLDYDGAELKAESVAHGAAATAPSEPENKAGWHFSGWDADFSEITADLTVTALYEFNSVEYYLERYDFVPYSDLELRDYAAGETVYFDILLVGHDNYALAEIRIAHDTDLLEFVGSQNPGSWASQVRIEAPNIVYINSVASLNINVGEPTGEPICLITLKFYVKENIAKENLEAALHYNSILIYLPPGIPAPASSVAPPVGYN